MGCTKARDLSCKRDLAPRAAKAMVFPCVNEVNFALLSCHFVTPGHWANMAGSDQDKWETILTARLSFNTLEEDDDNYETNYPKRITNPDFSRMKTCCSSACDGETVTRTNSNHPNNMEDYCAAIQNTPAPSGNRL